MRNSRSQDSFAAQRRLGLGPASAARGRLGSARGEGSSDLGVVAVYVGVMALALTGALWSRGLLHWVAIVLVVVTALAVATRSGPRRIGLVLAGVAAATAPWNAVVFGGLRPGDVALLGALVCLPLSGRTARALPRLVLPGWLLVLVLTVAALTLTRELIPTSPLYLASRVSVDAIGATTSNPFTNLGIGGRWLVSLVGVPVMCVLAHQQGHRVLGRLATAYVMGTAVSALVAVTDALGLTAISAHFIVPDSGGRQAGLTVHPNHLAATVCLAVPFVFWMFSRGDRRMNVVAALALVLLAAAEYESGSRGGAVCVLLAAALTLVLIRRLRSRLPVVVGGLFAAMFVVFGLFPDSLAQLLTSVRLGSSGAGGVDASDQVRATLGAQGVADFRHSPFFGIGMQVALDAHNIYRQLLAAGGIVLFGAFVVFAVGALRRALQIGRDHPLACAAAASIAAWLLFGMVENLLTDRFLYVPVGIVVALVQRTGPEPDAGSHGAPAASTERSVPATAGGAGG